MSNLCSLCEKCSLYLLGNPKTAFRLLGFYYYYFNVFTKVDNNYPHSSLESLCARDSNEETDFKIFYLENYQDENCNVIDYK